MPQTRDRYPGIGGSDLRGRALGGFTLLELMVVIGVIGILMSLLVPVVVEVRRDAKTMQCVANYRSMGQTFLNYAADYEGKLPKKDPYGGAWTGTWYKSTSWYGHSVPAIGNWNQAGSPDIRVIVQGYVPDKFNFKSWQCPFIDGPPMGDMDANGNYREPLGTDHASVRVYGNFCMPFITNQIWATYSNQIWLWIRNGVVGQNSGFPTRLADGVPGLVLAQDAFWDLPYNATGLMAISHLKGGEMQSHPSTAQPGNCVNVVQGPSLGLGASMVFYDGSARFVPKSEMRMINFTNSSPVINDGYTIWSTLP